METFTNGAHPATFVCILMEWLLNSIVKKVSLFCSSSSKCVLTLGVGHVENSKKNDGNHANMVTIRRVVLFACVEFMTWERNSYGNSMNIP